MPTTNIKVIVIVVSAISILAVIGMGALAYCLIFSVPVQEGLVTAFFGLEGSIIGYLGGILTSTKSHPSESIPTEITNSPDHPIPTQSIATEDKS